MSFERYQAEAYVKPNQTSAKESFAKIVTRVVNYFHKKASL